MNVSIIIPAHNAAETIADTLESVLAQTFSNWEAVVVDDGSSDGTAEIAGSFAERDGRIRLIRQSQNGEAGARNAGISLAHYDWLLFLDSDDWISPLHLERLTNELLSHPDLDAVHCSYARVALDGTQVVEKYLPPSGDLFPIFARRAWGPPHVCIVRRSLVEAVGKFDTSLQKSPDWDLWQRIARTGARFGVVREVLAFYRMRPNSASLDAQQMLIDGLRVLKQGHSPDPRVANPHPDHVNGLPQELVPTQEFYLVCWCAGLLLGSGKDARFLLETIKGDNYPELYPDAVAQCIFEAAPLPTCQSPQGWEKLWPGIEGQIDNFLVALEKQSMAPDLARRASRSLKKMILKHSPNWRPILEEYEDSVEKQKTFMEEMEKEKKSLEKERDDWKRVAEGREKTIGEQRASIEELERRKVQLEKERDDWEQLSEEFQSRLSELEKKVWFRLGSKLTKLFGDTPEAK